MEMKKVLGILLISLLTACASQTKQPGADVEDRSMGGATTTTEPGEGGRMGDGGGPILNPLTDPRSVLSRRSIYFDFDSYVVKDEFRPLVVAHGQYLRDDSSKRMLLQGNTDERGSREYNLALGQRRADAVKYAMTLSGAREAQIEAVSLGEEKPRTAGHDEAAWAENRRVDIRYQGE